MAPRERRDVRVVEDLAQVLDMDAIRDVPTALGVDPLGGVTPEEVAS